MASGLQKSFGTLVRLAGFDKTDADVEEEEIIVEPVSPYPQKLHDVQASRQLDVTRLLGFPPCC
jgi:hypothetical protein